LHKDAKPMKSPTALTHRSAPPLAIPPPTCLECGHVMRIVALEPHFSFNFLDVLEYKCECSATLRFSVARWNESFPSPAIGLCAFAAPSAAQILNVFHWRGDDPRLSDR